MQFALSVPVTRAINPHIALSTVLLIVNRTLYIVSLRSAISALATCNITPSNVQYRRILHSVCTVAPIENIYVVRLVMYFCMYVQEYIIPFNIHIGVYVSVLKHSVALGPQRKYNSKIVLPLNICRLYILHTYIPT